MKYDDTIEIHRKIVPDSQNKELNDYVDSRVFTEYLENKKSVFTKEDIDGYIDDFYKIKEHTDPEFLPKEKI